jgi:large subunit ribosomal protein L18
MAKEKIFVVPYRRKRKGLTNFKKRTRYLLSGKTRLVVRRSASAISAQLIDYVPSGDKVVLSATSKELAKNGWKGGSKSVPAAYLVGVLIAKKAKGSNIHEAVPDIGLSKSTKGSRLYAVIKGAIDGGLTVPHTKDILPSDDRVRGQHITTYMKSAHGNQFGKIKASLKPEEYLAMFDQTKKKILA